MRLIDYDHRVVLEQKVRLDLLEQDAIRHELKLRSLAREEFSVMPNLIAYLFPKLRAELLRHPLSQRHSCDSPRLGDPNQQRRPYFALLVVVFELPWACLRGLIDELRYLSRFTATSLSTDDRNHEVFYVLHDLTLMQNDWQSVLTCCLLRCSCPQLGAFLCFIFLY